MHSCSDDANRGKKDMLTGDEALILEAPTESDGRKVATAIARFI